MSERVRCGVRCEGVEFIGWWGPGLALFRCPHCFYEFTSRWVMNTADARPLGEAEQEVIQGE